MLAFEVAGGRAAGRAVIDALTLPELTASLGSVHTMVVHPPSTSQRQLERGRARRSRHPPGPAARARSGSRTSRTCMADFGARARPPRGAGRGAARRPTA